jgi:hypothetical protein
VSEPAITLSKTLSHVAAKGLACWDRGAGDVCPPGPDASGIGLGGIGADGGCAAGGFGVLETGGGLIGPPEPNPTPAPTASRRNAASTAMRVATRLVSLKPDPP